MPNYSAEVREGPSRLGNLLDRGAFDAYTPYVPGEVVIDTNLPYLNILATGVLPLATDTFGRRDDVRWGLTSGGQDWAPYVQAGDDWAATIAHAQGALSGEATAANAGVLLFDALSAATSREVLVRLSLDAEGAPGETQAVVVIGSDADQNNYSRLDVLRADGDPLTLTYTSLTGGASATTAHTSALTAALGDVFWVRARRQGSTIKARAWAEGTPEPAAWDLSTALVAGAWGSRSGVGFLSAGPTGVATFRYASARDLASATAPSGDSDHWTALADAFPQLNPV